MEFSIHIDENSNLAIWFLGSDTKQLKAALTFENRGPVKLNFNNLTQQEQVQVLRDIKLGKVVSSVKYEVLYDCYKKAHGKPKSVVPEQQKELLKKIEKHQLKRIKAEERINYLLKQPARSIRSALRNEKDTKILYTFKRLEEQGKKRKLVLSFLQDKINYIQEQIIKKVNSPGKTKLPSTLPKESISYNVIDSEQEIVKFAIGKPLVSSE